MGVDGARGSASSLKRVAASPRACPENQRTVVNNNRSSPRCVVSHHTLLPRWNAWRCNGCVFHGIKKDERLQKKVQEKTKEWREWERDILVYHSAILKHQKVSSKMLWKEKRRTWVKTQWPHWLQSFNSSSENRDSGGASQCVRGKQLREHRISPQLKL